MDPGQLLSLLNCFIIETPKRNTATKCQQSESKKVLKFIVPWRNRALRAAGTAGTAGMASTAGLAACI